MFMSFTCVGEVAGVISVKCLKKFMSVLGKLLIQLYCIAQ